jgi:hypothetical protein
MKVRKEFFILKRFLFNLKYQCISQDETPSIMKEEKYDMAYDNERKKGYDLL